MCINLLLHIFRPIGWVGVVDRVGGESVYLLDLTAFITDNGMCVEHRQCYLYRLRGQSFPTCMYE